MPPAIQIENLSKRYRIGPRQHGGYRTLRETVMDAATSPWRRLRNLAQRLNHASSNGAPHEQNDRAAPEFIWALKDVNLEVPHGEVLGIIGRNGAGKSTLLKVLSRITEPSHGRVLIDGRVASLLEVGTGFHQELTGRENIFLNGAILGMTHREIRRKFDEIVAFAEIDQFLDMPVKRYSSGMYVRLAFAVAAHLEPDILIVDEVLAVGDRQFQQKCLGRMRNISQLGRTVLFVSHQMATVQNLCRNVVVMDTGRIIYNGSCQLGLELYHQGLDSLQSAEVDLASHPGRRPGCVPLMQRLRILDASGRLTNRILCGEALALELTFSPCPGIIDLHCWIQFFDELGTKLFTVSTELSPTSPIPLDRPKCMVCAINELPLAPGNYYLTLQAGPHGQRTADFIDRSVSLSVVEADYYGNGCLPQAFRGKFVVRSDWNEVADPASVS